MDLIKQIIDQRVQKTIEDNKPFFAAFSQNREKQVSLAFLLLGVASYLDIEIAEAVEYITEGGDDGGFDAAFIGETGDGMLQVILFQSKYKRDLEKDSQFPANAIEKAVTMVKNIFDPKRQMQLNSRSKKFVDEMHSFIDDGIIPNVTFVMINNGSIWNQDGQNYIDNEFKGQKQVVFKYINHKNIIQYVNKHEKINETLSLNGLALKEDFNYKEVLLGRITVEEIARILMKYGDDLLDKNIRKYLGANAVNKAIKDTLMHETECQNFFFYNNGITMICSDFKYNALQKEDWKVRAHGLQIINGGQTCKTICQTLQENPSKDFSKASVLLRLYAVGDDESVVEGITRATNSQNPVDFRDLKSNDEIQRLLEQNAKELGFTYKRKRDNQTNMDVIPSSVAAESVFAIWRKKPHLARYKKASFFDINYDEIFEGLNAAQMIIAVLIFRMCDAMRKKWSDDPEINAQRPYSQYVIGTIIGQNLLKHFNISLHQLIHTNFIAIKDYFENNKEDLFNTAQGYLMNCLLSYFPDERLANIDGRTLAAVFRRFDFVEKVLKNNY
jgi:hypothetical protein